MKYASDPLYAQLFRILAGEEEKDGENVLDYTVLSVAVLTLGLLMVVEFARHKLDQAATGRPFFKTVLEGMYRELATLGLVEFAVYLVQSYTDYNKAMKEVFADVHFMLFYAALFNALESCLLAVCTSRVSNRLWVRTEHLDVANYLELRQEFDRVEKELRSAGEDPTAEVAFEWSWKGLRHLCHGVRDALKHPLLKRKHHKLLVQVRFHELRVHFLKANDLPPKLKVSDYLIRSEMHVLKKMVHISPFAWLLLTGGLNLLYFLMGMVAYVTEDLDVVGTAMSAIFFFALVAFVVVSLLIFNKMKSIYRSIMHKKLIDACVADETDSQTSESVACGATEQLKLFWGGEPKYIVAMMQLMQIGFAIAISILIVFPDEFDGDARAWQFFIEVALSYALFLIIMARVIPRYTLCTSLGQLVNKRRLQETLGAFHLEEARKNRRIRQEVKEAERAYVLKQTLQKSKGECSDMSDSQENRQDDSHGSFDVSALDLAIGMAKSFRTFGESGGTHTRSESSGSDRVLLTSLVETKTEDLPSVIPPEIIAKRSRSREEKIKARRQSRRKTVSDGVAAMRLMRPTKLSDAAMNTLESFDDTSNVEPVESQPKPLPPRRRDRARIKSLSANAAIEMMRKVSATDDVDDTTMAPVKSSTKQNRPEPLHPLVEDIPIMSVPASKISIPVGRQSLPEPNVNEEHHDQEVAFTAVGSADIGTSSKVRFSEPLGTQLEAPRRSGSSKGDDSSDAMGNDGDIDTVAFTAVGSADIGTSSKVRFSEPLGTQPEAPRRSGSSKGDSSDAMGNDGDIDTVDTDGSDDGHSDVDDVPDIAPSEKAKLDEDKPVVPLGDELRAFFSGRIYKHMSAIFGTMICFFLVGMRVETLLHATDAVGDPGNTWEFIPGQAFWLETAWLCMFILISSLVVFIFRPVPVPDNERLDFFIVGMLDVTLSSLCLVLLMLSEARRTCDETTTSCSQTFGNRVGEGVGNIEPFTSLIALRICRFVVARRLVAFTYHRVEQAQFAGNQSSYRASASFRLGYFDQSMRSDGHNAKKAPDHADKSMQNETGTLVELWNFAIGFFPDVVEKYGEFSGELLQAMLGLEIVDEEPAKPLPATESKNISDFTQNIENDTQQHLTDRGQVSKPAKSAGALSFAEGVRLGSPQKNVSDVNPPTNGMLETSHLAPMAPLEFDVDSGLRTTESSLKPSKGTSPFIAPNARLVRSMRRCDRKLLPLLDAWTTVDVVMTKYELVYFEAPSVFEKDIVNIGDKVEVELHQKGRLLREAVVSTNGGKGLRLGDIAEGRKVAGHLELSSIHAIHIERSMPKRESAVKEFDPSPYMDDVNDEFWKSHTLDHCNVQVQNANRQRRWERVKQDDLVVESVQGTLHLRFYSDLSDTAMHQERSWNEREENGEIFKNNAFQWCQTVVRLCGTQQLKQQDLPHFGDENSEELRDYLVVVGHNFHDGTKRIVKPGLMRRSRSSASLTSMVERAQRRLSRAPENNSPASSSHGWHRRFNSMESNEALNHRRFSSMESNEILNHRRFNSMDSNEILKTEDFATDVV